MATKTEKITDAKTLKETLFAKRPHAGKVLSDAQWKEAYDYCEGYKSFLTTAKTEREATAYAVGLAKKAGFTEFKSGKKYKSGEKVYLDNRGKSVILAVIGKKSLAEGTRIAAAHIDSPRLDLKPHPLYEDNELALFKTHYYGGIKKYQWTALPLALHGVIIKKDGKKINVTIGEAEDEPKFCITDLLPHLGAEQGKRLLSEGIKGEELNVVIGSRPFSQGEESELVKLNILSLFYEKYGITEEDFWGAELELVPALPVSDIGLDRALIGGYGQDDRVCAYPALSALFQLKGTPARTAIVVLADKEETGSEGNTGIQGAYLQHFIEALCEGETEDARKAGGRGVPARDCLDKSECLSVDVEVAFDPTWASVHEKQNSAYLNKGVAIKKYGGSRGKSGTNDAGAELTSRTLSTFRKAGILYQMGEMGKVDEGGGGTVAKFIAKLGPDVIDVGVPLLSMHSPYELAAKADIWGMHKAIGAFFVAE